MRVWVRRLLVTTAVLVSMLVVLFSAAFGLYYALRR